MSKELIKKIQKHIISLDAWKHTDYDKYDEDFTYCFHGLRLNYNQILVLESYGDSYTDTRDFHIYNSTTNKMKKMSGLRDDIYRTYDDHIPILDHDNTFLIIGKDETN